MVSEYQSCRLCVQDGGCQPGSSKCLGSSFMVCAAEVLPIPTAQLAFSACFMKGTLGLQDQSYGAVMNTAKMVRILGSSRVCCVQQF